MAVRLEPVVEMNLVQVGSHSLFSQFMSFGAYERHAPTCQEGDQCLHDVIGIGMGGAGDKVAPAAMACFIGLMG